MANDLISPEEMDIAETYLKYTDVALTAQALDLPVHMVADFLEKPPVKRFIDNMYLQAGFRNRHRIGDVLDEMMAHKLLEAQESEQYTKADLLEILKFAHKVRIDEAELIANASKRDSMNIKSQTNVQINGNASNLDTLVGKLIDANKKQD